MPLIGAQWTGFVERGRPHLSGHAARFGLRLYARERVEGPTADALSPVARAWLVAVVAAAVVAAAATLPAPVPGLGDWLTFAALAAAAAAAQHLIIATGRHQAFPLSIVFLVAAALLLPPELVALVGIAHHLPELARRRFRRHISVFNVANYTLAGLAAWGAFALFRDTGLGSQLRWAAGAIAAALVFVAVNHVNLAVMLRLARGRSIRATGLLGPDGLLADLAPAALGVVFARFWLTNPYLIPLVVAPLALIQQSFALVARLGESEERFRALFECAPIGTALVDLEERIVSGNRALEQLLGYGDDELLGRDFRDLVPGDGAGGARRELLPIDGEPYDFEARLRRKDGAPVSGHVAVALVRDAQRRPRFGIVMVEDLSERRELEEQLRQAQKMEAVGELAGGIAHDFNNLLTIISGRARIALRSIGGDQDLRGDVEEIAAAADRAATLTGQLLAFGRRQVLQPRVFELNTVVGATERMLRRLIGEHIEVVLELAPAVGRVRADPRQVEQVIINLALNARDAMPAGGRLTIRTLQAALEEPGETDGAAASRDYVVLSLSDTGHGMDARIRSHIFEPFFTTKEPGKGTGLGLATVHGIVAQSGGELRVRSAPGMGSTFAVYLPRVEDAEEAPEQAPVPAAGALGGSETVLLVEDDGGVRALAEVLLSEVGYAVLAARDGNDALRIVERHEGSIDLLLTDVVMPGLGGVALAEEVRRMRPGIGVVYMSGYPGDELRGVTGHAGLVAKPFTLETLLRPVRGALDAAAAAQGRVAAAPR
ncbi:MAG: hypothetical protein V7644_2705 [Actinomycetota bacterium]